MIFVHTGYANFGFNWCSVYTEFFLIWEKVQMVKSTPPQIPTTQYKNPPLANFTIPPTPTP